MSAIIARTMEQYKLTDQMLQGQYSARMALLMISRDLHHISQTDAASVLPGDSEADADNIGLSFKRTSGGDVDEFTYFIFDGANGKTMLGRNSDPKNITPFVPIELSGLRTEWVNIDGTPAGSPISDENKRFIKITVTARLDNPDTAEDERIEFDTTISVSRIPPKAAA
jgi:hypothetical protein